MAARELLLMAITMQVWVSASRPVFTEPSPQEVMGANPSMPEPETIQTKSIAKQSEFRGGALTPHENITIFAFGNNASPLLSLLQAGDVHKTPNASTNSHLAKNATSNSNTVYILTTMYNRGPLFIKCLESFQTLHRTDTAMHWVVVDYGTWGVDVKDKLFNSGIVGTYVNMQGQFSRAEGLQTALEMVPHDNDLVLMCDLINVPNGLLNRARQSAVQGVKFYAPTMKKLYPGSPVHATNDGNWYDHSFGILGFIKHDAMTFGGILGASYSKIDIHRWGCEDVYFAKEFLDHGLHVVRERVIGLVHYTLTDWEKEELHNNLPENEQWREYNNGANHECEEMLEHMVYEFSSNAPEVMVDSPKSE